MSKNITPESKAAWRPKSKFPQRALHMMAKPPAEELSKITALPRIQADRPANLHHWTVLSFVDLADWPANFVSVLLDRMNGFEADAFDLVFDHIAERRAVTLRSSHPQLGARALQTYLVEYLTARDFPFFGKPPEPHLTINYRGDGLGHETIHPIGWTVDEIILVESINGQKTHLVHGRWPLRRRRH